MYMAYNTLLIPYSSSQPSTSNSTTPLRHLPLLQRLQILFLMIMRRSLIQPLGFNRHTIAHILLGRLHQLIINQRLNRRIRVHQYTRRMNVYRTVIFNRTVAIPASCQDRSICEKARYESFLDRYEVGCADS